VLFSYVFLISNNEEINLNDYKIKEINSRFKNNFLNKYHLKGQDISNINIGIFYKHQIIFIVTLIKENDNFKISRLCSKYQQHHNDLFKLIINYLKDNYIWKEICVSSDLCWEDEYKYEKLNFKYIKQSKPKYSYKSEKLKIYDCGYINYCLKHD
jgi:hypothetical protein